MDNSRENRIILAVIIAAAVLLLGPYLGLSFLFSGRTESELHDLTSSGSEASKQLEQRNQERRLEIGPSRETGTAARNHADSEVERESPGELAEIEKLLKR